MIINPLSIKPKTWLEEKAYNLLQELEIESPQQINLEMICYSHKVDLLYTNTRSYSTIHPTKNGWYQLYINYSIPKRQQREIIAHELGHILYHSGNQLFMERSFINLQENQTENFVAFLLAPFYMLKDMEIPDYNRESIYFLAEFFNITLPLAKRRYDQLISRQFEYRYYVVG